MQFSCKIKLNPAIMIIPAVSALFKKGFKTTWILSTILTVIIGVPLGLFLSFISQFQEEQQIVIVLLSIFILTLIFKK